MLYVATDINRLTGHSMLVQLMFVGIFFDF